MKRYFIAEFIGFLIILLFVYTAASKFMDYDRFVFQMEIAPLPLMRTLAPTLGWLIPGLEALVAALTCFGLFIPRLIKSGLTASLCLMITFQIYIILMLLSGYSLPCTCGGIISHLSWKGHVVFNAVVIALNSTALIASKKDQHSKENYKDFSRV